MDKPTLPPHLKTNFTILAPRNTHWRPATCAEVDCDRYVNGFEIVLDVSDELPLGGLERATYLRSGMHGRRFEEYRAEGSTIVTFRFPPGQQAFGPEHEEHLIRIDRPELFVVHGVDRDTGRHEIVRHDGQANGAVNWTDQFAHHQDQLATAKQRG